MPTTATSSNLSPADTSIHQPVDGVVSIDWTPTSGLNPITGTPTIVGNGFSCVVTTESLGGGALRCTAIIPAYAGRLNSLSSVCTTQDTNTNTTTWSYTALRNWGWSSSASDFVSNKRADSAGPADYVTIGGAAIFGTDNRTDWFCRQVGALFSTQDAVDFSVMDMATGMLNQAPEAVDFYAVDQEYAVLTTIGANVGEFGQNIMPVGANVRSTDYAQLVDVGANIGGTDYAQLIDIGANIATKADGVQLVAVGANVGTFGQSVLPIGAVIDRALAELHIELFIASEALQEIELEP